MSSNINRVTTRAKNAHQHPGLVDLDNKRTRRTAAEVAAEHKLKVDAKNEKERTKRAGIQRVAKYEKSQAEQDAAEATPRAMPIPKSKSIPRSKKKAYAEPPPSDSDSGAVPSDIGAVPSDIEMDDEGSSAFKPDVQMSDLTSEPDEGEPYSEALLSPPRKRAKVVLEKARKAKASKAKPVRDAIRDVEVSEPERMVVGGRKMAALQDDSESDVEVLNPMPKKPNKKSIPLKSAKSAHCDEDHMDIDPPLQKPSTMKAGEKVVLPAVHSDNDSTVTDRPPKKRLQWTMPILSDGEGNPKPKAQSRTRVDQIKERNKEKAKEMAKAKTKARETADGTDKDRDQPNSKRYIPIIIASHFRCLLLMKQLSIIFFSVTPLLMARTSPLASMIGQQASQIMQGLLVGPPPASPAFSKIANVPAPVVAPPPRP